MLTAPAQTIKEDGERRLIFSLQDQPGSLNNALELLSKHGLNMSHIESRPSITLASGYDFFVALSASSASKERLDAVMAELKASGASDINFLSETKSENAESTYSMANVIVMANTMPARAAQNFEAVRNSRISLQVD